MSRTIRQKLGPVKKRVKSQVEEAKLLIESTEEEPVETRIKNLTKIYSKLQKNLETLKSLQNEYTLKLLNQTKKKPKDLMKTLKNLRNLFWMPMKLWLQLKKSKNLRNILKNERYRKINLLNKRK